MGGSVGNFLFGQGPSVDFQQSPQQAQLWNQWSPVSQNLASGNLPPIYNLPNANMLQPTGDWWSGMAPELKAGIMQPFQEASQQLNESLGARGMVGGGRSGATGAQGAAQGQFWAQAAPQMAMTGWGMTAPGRQMQYQAELGQAQTGYNTSLMPYQMLPNMIQQSLPYPVVNQGTPGLIPSMAPMLGAGLGMALGGPLGGMLGGAIGSGFQNPFSVPPSTPPYLPNYGGIYGYGRE